MRKIEFRSIQSGTFVAGMLLGVVFLSGAISAMGMLLPLCDGFWQKSIVILILSLYLLLPAMWFLVTSMLHYATKIVVTKDAVVKYRFNKQILRLGREEISAYGCACFMAHSNHMFFCAVSAEDVLTYGSKHQEGIRKLFGGHAYRLSKTEQGQFEMSLGALLRYGKREFNKRIILTGTASAADLARIRELWDEPPTFTGMFLYDARMQKNFFQ